MRCVGAMMVVMAVTALASGCGGGGDTPRLSPAAERGRRVYMSNCTACHNPDPTRDGALGPKVKGSSRELLDARVLRADYPPGYTPQRPTKVMVPLPSLAGSVDDLAEYLAQ